MLGGSLKVRSKLGEGSTFTVRLPRGYAHLPADHVVHEQALPPELAPDTPRDMAFIEKTEAWRVVESSSAVTTPNAGSGQQIDFLLQSPDLGELRDDIVLVVDDK
jgi:hypothetical protein